MTSRRSWRLVALAVALLASGAGLGFLAAAMRSPATGSADLPRFKQLTFRRGDIRIARFAPDGQSILYSALWDGEPQRIYPVRLERPRADAPAIVDGSGVPPESLTRQSPS
jgi:hypothetical protein